MSVNSNVNVKGEAWINGYVPLWLMYFQDGGATWRPPYPYVFPMAYYTLTRILYYLNELNVHECAHIFVFSWE